MNLVEPRESALILIACAAAQELQCDVPRLRHRPAQAIVRTVKTCGQARQFVDDHGG
jgi:hypothetical protein